MFRLEKPPQYFRKVKLRIWKVCSCIDTIFLESFLIFRYNISIPLYSKYRGREYRKFPLIFTGF